LCVSRVCRSPQRVCELVELDLVGVALGRVDTRMTEQARAASRRRTNAVGSARMRATAAVAVGEVNSFDFALARITSDGRLDPTFGDGGKVLTDFTLKSNCAGCSPSNDVARAVAVQANGKIVAVGFSNARAGEDVNGQAVRDFALARYKRDGSLDTSFGQGGKVLTDFGSGTCDRLASDLAQAMVVQPNGTLVLAGLTRRVYADRYDFALARYTARGDLDPNFGGGGKVTTDFGSG